MKRKSVKEGESVTLDPGETKHSNHEMTWYFNEILIAEITGNQSKICTDNQCEERFRDRLKLDHQTGSLTIMNTRTTDSGEYELKINKSIGRFIIIKSFSVNVTAAVAGIYPADVGVGVSVGVGVLLLVAGLIYGYVKNGSRMQSIDQERDAQYSSLAGNNSPSTDGCEMPSKQLVTEAAN